MVVAADAPRIGDALDLIPPAIAVRVAHLEPELRGTIAERVRAAVRVHFKGQQYAGGAWGDVTIFRFDPEVTPSMENMKAMLERRRTTQPLGLPSCGSVFRNPPGDYSARLIEAAGLKGYGIGGAEVSEKHANFIINTGAATAADIEALIEHVQRTVLDVHGVELVHEVRIVGEALK